MKRLLTFVIFLFAICSIKAQSNSNDTLIIVDNIELIGNKVTVDRILFREITFRPGDTLRMTQFRKMMIKSQENLMNTSLFNFVTITDILQSEGHDIAHYKTSITVVERWYIWPLPIFELAERNFNTWWETKDLNMINYGFFLTWDNFRGRKEQLKLLLQFGYDEKLGFSYDIPYINKKQTLGLNFGFSQKKNHASSYITKNNQVQRIRLEDGHAKKTYEAFLSLGLRPDIHQTHFLEMSYNELHFSDTLLMLNPMYYQGEDNTAQYFKLSYFLKSDHRDYKSYPLKGYYFDLLIEKLGFGLFKGTEINLINAKANIRKFWTLSKRWYVAGSLTGRIGNKGQHPYFVSTGLGYGNSYIRGYEYYVIDGQDYGLIKTDIKFALIPQRVSVLKFIPTDKFNKIPWAVYISLFGDAGFAPGNGYNGNTLQDELLLGYGLGLNLVTYYDMVFRIEYSFNKMGESGIFIHFVSSI